METMPRVLVISHTSFTASNSMGSTLAAYLSQYDADSVAQLYIKDMMPDIPEAVRLPTARVVMPIGMLRCCCAIWYGALAFGILLNGRHGSKNLIPR